MQNELILIRGNRLVARSKNFAHLMEIASSNTEHATVYDLDTMKCVAEFNAFKPVGAECEHCGATS